MPTYTYTCTACNDIIEKRQSFTDPPLTTCEQCGGTLRKVIHPVGIVFKGSGFYKNDSRSNGSRSGGSRQDSRDKDKRDKESSSSDSGSSTDTVDGSVPYGEILAVIDAARGAGVVKVGIVTEGMREAAATDRPRAIGPRPK